MLARRACCGEKSVSVAGSLFSGELSAAIVFPVDAEPHAVRGPLPGHVIVEMEAPGERVLSRRASERQAGLRDGD